ncbi:hypothetical protein R3W88_026489 [Solanum pinnatisectum]|uniref:Uncharacterized protein n=1 Tax=Solanum pinnatisectum TaxID=50273 RepID=A0AAV9LGS7_9SOLN|nr:hypothetical protein R3W88_026489 [Solanum pinnatisectum]
MGLPYDVDLLETAADLKKRIQMKKKRIVQSIDEDVKCQGCFAPMPFRSEFVGSRIIACYSCKSLLCMPTTGFLQQQPRLTSLNSSMSWPTECPFAGLVEVSSGRGETMVEICI